MESPLRIAMWSGPRNISTAMMRAWENRDDTFVSDEPFYAHYLAHTGIIHPGQDAILKSQTNNWQEVVKYCLSASKKDCSIHFQKHMTQHILPHITLDWLLSVKNIFLIRSPDAVVASYAKSRAELSAADLGFEQQARLFDFLKQHLDSPPLVLDSSKLLEKPKAAMMLLCDHCGIAFEESMLNWPPGKRDSDGVWAPHWYHSVENSTCFVTPAKHREIKLTDNQLRIADQCQTHYEQMAKHTAVF